MPVIDFEIPTQDNAPAGARDVTKIEFEAVRLKVQAVALIPTEPDDIEPV